jgi:hypothetical protein
MRNVLEREPRLSESPVLGTLLSVTEEGVPLVDYPRNSHGPLPAKVACDLAPEQAVAGSSVLLVFENGDGQYPVILGAVSDRLPVSSRDLVSTRRWKGEVALDGRRLVIEAREEIVLRCGKGSITVRADGKVLIKGTELVSRSSGVNKIRGALVNIN